MGSIPMPRTDEELWAHMQEEFEIPSGSSLVASHGFQEWTREKYEDSFLGQPLQATHERDHNNTQLEWGHDHPPTSNEDSDGTTDPGGTVLDRG